MTSKSKSKGSSWERDIANHLTVLYGQKFVRVPNSGAYVGGQNAHRKTQLDAGQIRGFKGDIIPPSEWVHFNCEAKNYGDFPFHQLVQGECKQLEKWIEQLLDAADSGDLNILIIKVSRKGKFVAVPQAAHWHAPAPFILYHSIKYGFWQIFSYDTFWEHNSQITLGLSLT